jgi:hypothetical protein
VTRATVLARPRNYLGALTGEVCTQGWETGDMPRLNDFLVAVLAADSQPAVR